MSDTTITPEERAGIRTPSDKLDALWYPHDRCHKMMLRLLDALEHAEARAEQAEAMVDWLANQAADICADAYPKSEVLRWWEDSNWKEAARRAVADESEVER